jgi:hypothetical protein
MLRVELIFPHLAIADGYNERRLLQAADSVRPTYGTHRYENRSFGRRLTSTQKRMRHAFRTIPQRGNDHGQA